MEQLLHSCPHFRTHLAAGAVVDHIEEFIEGASLGVYCLFTTGTLTWYLFPILYFWIEPWLGSGTMGQASEFGKPAYNSQIITIHQARVQNTAHRRPAGDCFTAY